MAKSIALYLHDDASPYRSLAIDLCSRGFQVWQQHVDAVEMLRALYMLATTTRKEAIAVPNIGVLARSAVLQIAADNTPLFMTTLAMDILHPRDMQYRKAVMQLVIFLIRKVSRSPSCRPAVLLMSVLRRNRWCCTATYHALLRQSSSRWTLALPRAAKQCSTSPRRS